jgi:hypothetical protein
MSLAILAKNILNQPSKEELVDKLQQRNKVRAKKRYLRGKQSYS